MCAAAVSRAEGFLGIPLPRDRQENRRNEKCMYLGRSQRTTQPVQVRAYQESAMMCSPFRHYSYILYIMLYVTSLWQADRVGILTRPSKLENVKTMFRIGFKRSHTSACSHEFGRYIKTPIRDVEKVENAFVLFFFEDREMKGETTLHRKTFKG